jgi:DNA mismatch repair protein MutL
MNYRDKSINKIKVLAANVANKIAAGEVVERPASVVKELLENSIDAEAYKITVVLKQSGKELIQVVDNGEGMSAADLDLAFERHATSKIASDQDLEKIETLGFRGEALPSIASVSQVEIKSRIKESPLGNSIRLEEGKIIDRKRVSCPPGTNIAIKNLFYNIPARRNFLRADTPELQQIIAVLKKFFIAYPDIEFIVNHNEHDIFHLKKESIAERIKHVFGEEAFANLLSLRESLGGIELSGFISKPDYVRRAAGSQYLFLNGRPIQHKSMHHAIMQGYSNLIRPGDYPVYSLFLEMSPKLFDVNVHPAKMEVRFSNERSLYHFFLHSIYKLFSEEKVVPAITISEEAESAMPFIRNQDNKEIIKELTGNKGYQRTHSGAQLSLAYFSPGGITEQSTDQKEDHYVKNTAAISYDTGTDVHVKFWQVHNCYIFSEIKSGIVVIDQHIAHERILYERILKVLEENCDTYSQQLLFPQTITLQMDDFVIFKEIDELFDKIGFSIRIFSGTTIVIDAIPIDVKSGREGQVVLDIIDYYKENPAKEFNPFHKMAAAFACKNAIKSGEPLSQAQMHALIDQLFACKSPYFCPHGRPVITTIELEDINRKFKRNLS